MAFDASSLKRVSAYFSAKEVHVVGDVIHLTVEVPVPENTLVKFVNEESLECDEVLKFVPPITVSLSPPEPAGADITADIHCVWIPLNNVSRVRLPSSQDG